jgi:hypothetical protein
VKIPAHRKILSFGLVYGCGPKVFGIAILDEIVAIYALFSRLLKGKLSLNKQHWIERALLIYFLFITLVGFIYNKNINTSRYFVIVIFLLFHSPCTTFNIGSMIVGAKAFLVSYFAIVFIGYILDLPVAFWQDSLWVGTAYAAVFSLFSAWLCILFAKNFVNAFLILFIYLFIAILADSRLQIILFVALIPAIFSIAQRQYGRRINYRKVVSIFALSIVTFILVNFTLEVSVGTEGNIFQSVKSTILDLSINHAVERDRDRKDSILASFNWADDHPFKFIFGMGILAHQVELTNYYPQSSDGVVRPTGFPAMIVDGGIILASLMLLNVFVTFFHIRRARIPLLAKLSAILVLALVWASIMIVNPFDAILFWLIIMPSGVLPFVLQEWVHRFNQEVLNKSNYKVQSHE